MHNTIKVYNKVTPQTVNAQRSYSDILRTQSSCRMNSSLVIDMFKFIGNRCAVG